LIVRTTVDPISLAHEPYLPRPGAADAKARGRASHRGAEADAVASRDTQWLEVTWLWIGCSRWSG